MSRNKKIPVPDPENEKEYICPSASWGDMTGLIPYAAENGGVRASCEELYPFLSEYNED